MYENYLVLVLLFFIGGNIIGISFQFYNDHHILAQSNQESEADDQESEANKEPEADDQESEANKEPEADDQEVSVDANGNVKITLDGKDDDKDDEIKFDIVSDPSHGQLDNFDKSDGKVTYAPDKDYSGDDEFKFKVIDNNGA
ncbi:MAG TPA: Ig-like domain-containing protein, partial [Nitrososphaeraceae archaeon]|nr:Ig-like domain-containing protein [Nitrososphaeraceae archaeon]